MSMEFNNPFPPSETKPAPKPKRKAGVFSARMESQRTHAEVQRERSQREQERAANNEEHIASITNLYRYLEAGGHTEACANIYKCDPWTYEPILLDDLIHERAKTNDPAALEYLRKILGEGPRINLQGDETAQVNSIRGLIRAGSWMTHERVLQDNALQLLKRVTRLEDQDWQTKIRHTDPDTAKELRQNLAQVRAELAVVERAIKEGLYGADAEPAARSIEDLNLQAWLDLKKVLIAHGLNLEQARDLSFTKPLIDEIETLRPLRDYLYFLRLYPHWVKKSPPSRAA